MVQTGRVARIVGFLVYLKTKINYSKWDALGCSDSRRPMVTKDEMTDA
jgi:hypothetical protein